MSDNDDELEYSLTDNDDAIYDDEEYTLSGSEDEFTELSDDEEGYKLA